MKQLTMGGFEWIALKEIGDKTLLISKEVLFNGYFDDRSNTYEKSKLNGFLNSQFINILKENDFDDKYIVNGVWPLTLGQYNIYIKNKIKNAENPWFLRTPGKDGYILAVNTDGEIYEEEITSSCGLRPAMMIDTDYINAFVSETINAENVIEENSEKDDIEQSVIELVNNGTSSDIANQLKAVRQSQIELEQNSTAIADATNKDIEDTLKKTKEAIAISHHHDKDVASPETQKVVNTSPVSNEETNKKEEKVFNTQRLPTSQPNNADDKNFSSDLSKKAIPVKETSKEKSVKDDEHTEFATDEIKEYNISIARLLHKNMAEIIHFAKTEPEPQTVSKPELSIPVSSETHTEKSAESKAIHHTPDNTPSNKTNTFGDLTQESTQNKSSKSVAHQKSDTKTLEAKEFSTDKSQTNNTSRTPTTKPDNKQISMSEKSTDDNSGILNNLTHKNQFNDNKPVSQQIPIGKVQHTEDAKNVADSAPNLSVSQPTDKQTAAPKSKQDNTVNATDKPKIEQPYADKPAVQQKPDNGIMRTEKAHSVTNDAHNAPKLPDKQISASSNTAEITQKNISASEPAKLPNEKISDTNVDLPVTPQPAKKQNVAIKKDILPPTNPLPEDKSATSSVVSSISSEETFSKDTTNTQHVIKESTITFEEVVHKPADDRSKTDIINKINKAVSEKTLIPPNNAQAVASQLSDNFDLSDTFGHQNNDTDAPVKPHSNEHSIDRQNPVVDNLSFREQQYSANEAQNIPVDSNPEKKATNTSQPSFTPITPSPPVIKEKQIKKNDNSTYQENNKKIRKSGSSIFSKLGKKDMLVEEPNTPATQANMSDIVKYYSSYSSQPSKEQASQTQRPSLRESELETLLATINDENEILKETIKKNNRLIVQLKTTLMEERTKYEELTKELNNLIKMKNKDFKAREKQYQETIDKYKALLAECAEELNKK